MPFRLGHATKAARGYALADASTAQPQKATPVKLSDEDTVAIAFEKIVANCIAQMQANEAAMLATGAVEAIHQFRVALRRLRAIVGAYRELIDDTVHAAWSIDLRWAQRACGPARDLDVLVLETLSQMSSHLPHDEAFQRFLQVANEERAAARREAIQALHNPRYAAMQLQLFQGLHNGAWRHALAGPHLDAPVREFRRAAAADPLQAPHEAGRALVGAARCGAAPAAHLRQEAALCRAGLLLALQAEGDASDSWTACRTCRIAWAPSTTVRSGAS